jgi:outer membrane protein TolC
MSHSASALLLMAAAAQGADQHGPPTVPMASSFANLPAAPDAHAPAAEWWTTFDDPRLDTLIRSALTQNFDIAEAAARLDRARAGERAANGARMPQLSLSASAAAARLSEEDPQLGASRFLPGFDRNQDRYALTAGASWEIDLFGRLGARSRAARSDALASAHALEAARLAVASEIAKRYVTLRLLQQRRIVAEHRAGALAEMERLAALRVARGVSPAIERDRLLPSPGRRPGRE